MTRLVDPGLEQHLVERCISGEQLARDTLCRQYQRPLALGIARRVHADAEDADVLDILQDVFVKLVASGWQRLRGFDAAHDSIIHFLLHQAAPHIRRWKRHDARRRTLISLRDGEHDPEDTGWNGANGLAVSDLLWNLPAEHRRFLSRLRMTCGPDVIEKPLSKAEQKQLERIRERLLEDLAELG